jgi:hypothetical protein
MDVAKYLFQRLHVGVRGGCLGGAEDAQRRGNIGTRAYGRVLEVAQCNGVDVLGHSGKGGRSHVREFGEETGVHREGQGLRVGHAVLCENVAHMYLDWSNEMVQAERSREMCMPTSWERSPMSLILNQVEP